MTNADIYEKYMDQYIELASSCGDNSDLQIELIGTLVFINNDRWDQILTETDFLQFLSGLLQSGAEDDMLLECIMLTGTLARNEKCCEAIAGSYVIGLLHDLLGAK